MCQISLGKTYIQHWYNIRRGLGIENQFNGQNNFFPNYTITAYLHHP